MVPDDVVRRAADGDDVGPAVAVEVAAAQVLGGDVAVEHGPGPLAGLPVEVVHRDPVILAPVAGEDLVVAVAVDVGDPEGVAVGQGRVEHGPGAELERLRLGLRPDGDLAAVPGLDRRQEVAILAQPAEVDLAATPLGASPCGPGDEVPERQREGRYRR